MDKIQISNAVLANGGGTFAVSCEPVVKATGYFVSLKGYETIVQPGAVPLADIIGLYVQLALSVNAYVGAWVDDINLGKVYIDLSVWVDNLTDALALGKANGQLAIWDCAAGKAISL